MISELPTRLRELREGKGKTCTKVGKELNISRQSLESYERGERTPDVFKLCDLANYYEVSTDYLLGLVNTKTSDTTVNSIGKYTGLSDFAIEYLHSKAIFGEGLTDRLLGENLQNFREALNDVLCIAKLQYIRHSLAKKVINDKKLNLKIDETGCVSSPEEKLKEDYIIFLDTMRELFEKLRYPSIDEDYTRYKITKAFEKIVDSMINQFFGEKEYYSTTKRILEAKLEVLEAGTIVN